MNKSLIACTISVTLLGGLAVAQTPKTKAPEGAVAYIQTPKDGETVTSPFTVRFGLKGIGVAPAGVTTPNTGHHHLLIDVATPPDFNAALPVTDNIKHFGGGQTETELTLQALEKGMTIQERPIRYRARPAGSYSKLSPFADGYRILLTMAVLLRNHRPLYFFSLFALGLLALDAVYAAAWAAELLPPGRGLIHGLVIAGVAGLAAGLVLLGVVLNAVNAGLREVVALMRRPR